MSDYDIFPDAEALISSVIRTGLDVGVFSSMPNTPEWPLILVQRIGGTPAVKQRLDAPELQFDVYADTKSEARLLALQARRQVLLTQGTTISHNSASGFVTQVDDSTGLQWAPDPANPPKNRYIFGMRVYIHV